MDKPERLTLYASLVATIGITLLITGILSLIVQRFHLTGIPTILPPVGETFIDQLKAFVLFMAVTGIGGGNLLCAYGLMRLDEWSWWLTIVVCIMDIIVALIIFAPLAIVPPFIIYYLLRPHVRATYKW